eukprot:197235_1
MTTITPLTTLGNDGTDVFGAEENKLVLFWFAVIIPIGQIIAFLIISYMLYTLIRSFKKKSHTKPIQISAYVVLIGYLIYNSFGIVTRLFLDETNCPVNLSLLQASYFFCRASIYYFFILRCQTVFARSPFKFSRWSLTCIYALITVLYGFIVLFLIGTAHQKVFDEETRICVVSHSGPARIIGRYVLIFAILGDFILGFLTIGLYVKKLRQFHKMIADGNESLVHVNLYHLAQKSAKYAWVAYLSTVLMIVGSMISFLLQNLWLDTIITTLCVYCSFKTGFSRKVQYYCCECCHNKWLLCICGCCCCPCCNERYYCFTAREEDDEPDEETQEIPSVPSKKSTTTGNTVETTKSTRTSTGNDAPKAIDHEYEITELAELMSDPKR